MTTNFYKILNELSEIYAKVFKGHGDALLKLDARIDELECRFTEAEELRAKLLSSLDSSLEK